jgi:hypothetical protein
MFRNVLMQISLKEKNVKTLEEFQNNFHQNTRVFTLFSIPVPKENKSAGRRVK